MLLVLMTMVLVLCLANISSADAAPRPEHPRPDFKREEWLNLNGVWRFDFDPNDEGEASNWYVPGRTFSREIKVPFPWQSPLSGINDTKYAGAAWYSREMVVPAEWKGQRVILKFGAVDWDAKIWVNGTFAGEHSGGYSAFELDITDLVEFGKPASLTVRVFDPETIDALPVGKQFWYTRTSGIWQTIYLEARSETYLSMCHISPDIDAKKADFEFKVVSPVDQELSLEIAITDPSGKIIQQSKPVSVKVGENALSDSIAVPDPALWSPETPNLYDVVVSIRNNGQIPDQVTTYFGMRKVEAKTLPGADYKYVFLNDKPVYLRGALNQAFHPEGVYTYPSEDVMKQDLTRAKEWGFNLLRMHIKIDEPLFLYWADKLGVLLMCDVPNFADPGYGVEAKARLERVYRDAVVRDYNHPAIIIWCLFNETWGLNPNFATDKEKQGYVESMYHLAKELDKTRLVEEMSPCCYDHVITDLNDWHFYINEYQQAKDHLQQAVDSIYPGSGWNYVEGRTQKGEPFMNGEYGGIAAFMGDREVSWCFKYLTNEIRLHEKICGYIYTELMDIEWEYNGMMRYDRSLKEFGYDPRLINNADVLVLDAAPGHQLNPGDKLSFEAYTSFFSENDYGKTTLKWGVEGTDSLGNPVPMHVLGSRPVTIERYHVRPAGTIEFTASDQLRAGTLRVWVENEKSQKVMENFISLAIEAPLPKLAGHEIITFMPGTYTDANWSGPLQSIGDNISGEWKFQRGGTRLDLNGGTAPETDRFFDDSAWETVNLPHFWDQPREGEHGWYRKKVRVGEAHNKQDATLAFGPIDDTSRIFLNDHLLGGLDNDWNSSQSFLVSDKLVTWDNTIAIYVQNTDGGVGMQGPVNLSVDAASNLWAEGTGYMQYEIPVASLDGIKGLHLRFEASAEEPGLKQTDEARTPTDLTVSVGGVELGTITLVDAPCDIRGTVSRINEFRDSKYGYLVDMVVPREKMAEVIASAEKNGKITVKLEVKEEAVHKNGLLLFGRNAGRYGIDPMLIIER